MKTYQILEAVNGRWLPVMRGVGEHDVTYFLLTQGINLKDYAVVEDENVPGQILGTWAADLWVENHTVSISVARDPLRERGHCRTATVDVGGGIFLTRHFYKTTKVRTYSARVACANGTTVRVAPRMMQAGFHLALKTAQDVQALMNESYRKANFVYADNYEITVQAGLGSNELSFRRKEDIV